MNIMKKTAAFLIAASMLSATSCSLDEFFNGKSYSDENNYQSAGYLSPVVPQVHQLVADDVYKPLDDEDGIIFETALDESESGEDVALYDENKQKVATFCDDGTNGDKAAGDGIYTCTYRPEVNGEEERSFTVKSGNEESEPVKVRYFDELTEEDFSKADEVNLTFMESVAEYKTDNGYIKKGKGAEAISKAAEVAEELLNSGEAVKYEVNEKYNNVVVKLSSGITYVYSNPTEGVEESATANSALNVCTYQPCKDSLGTVAPDDAADIITDEFSNISFTKNLDNSDVTRDVVKAFGSDQIIIWNGHGGYSPTLHSFIVLGETIDSKDVSSDDDYIKDRIVLCGSKPNYTIAFTYKFIDEYVGDMSNTLLYMGCCETAHDSVLASSFLNKNCNLYIGFSDSVLASYDRGVIKSFFENLANEKTFFFFFKNGYRTAYEAMEEAKDDCGKESKYTDDDGYTHLARPVMFGNNLFKLSDAVSNELDTAQTTVTGISGSLQLDKAYVSVKKGETVGITVASYPSGYTTADLKWTIANASIASCIGGTITGIEKGTTKLRIETTDGKFVVECAVSVT